MSRRSRARAARKVAAKVHNVGVSLIRYRGDVLDERCGVDLAQIHAARQEHGVKWINVDGVHDRELVNSIGECFGLHALVIEDIVHTHQRAKLEEHGAYLFACVKMLYPSADAEDVLGEQLSVVLGRDFVLTFQEEEREGDVFGEIRERLRSPGTPLRHAGSDRLFYAILDAVVDEYFDILEEHEEQITVVDEALEAEAETEGLRELHRLKRKTIYLRRSIWPVRELVGRLERAQPTSLIARDLGPHLGDLYDHVVRVIEMTESSMDLLGTLHDLTLSLVSNRMNRVMKVLTVISTIFMPLTFLAGVYGMNFRHMPETQWRWGYPVVLGVMVLVGAIMFVIFKRKRWF